MDQAEVANHTLELLRHMNAKIDALGFDIQDIKARLGSVEEAQSSVSVRMAAVEVSMTGTIKRLDRLDERLARIERRLDLRGAGDE
jgi:hypothetical protein